MMWDFLIEEQSIELFCSYYNKNIKTEDLEVIKGLVNLEIVIAKGGFDKIVTYIEFNLVQALISQKNHKTDSDYNKKIYKNYN